MRCVFALLMLALAAPSWGVMLGYVSGNDYLSFDQATQMGWLYGALDGLIAESLMHTVNEPEAPPRSWVGDCLEGLPVSQIKAMFHQELGAHPDGWNAPAALLLHGRLERFCGRSLGDTTR